MSSRWASKERAGIKSKRTSSMPPISLFKQTALIYVWTKKLSKQICNTGRTDNVFGLFPLRQQDGLPSHLVSTWRIKPESLPLSVFVRVSVCIPGGLQSHVCSQLTVSRRCFFGGGTRWDCIDGTVSPCQGMEIVLFVFIYNVFTFIRCEFISNCLITYLNNFFLLNFML